MSKLPNDDQRLVDFLRQNRPEIPPSSPDLEEKLFQAIASSTLPQLHHNSRKHSSRYRQLWLVPPAIAASVALVLAGNYLRGNSSLTNSFAINKLNNNNSSATNLLVSKSNYLPEQNYSRNRQELVKIESFLENNWSGVVTNNAPETSVETMQNEYLNLADKTYYPTKTTHLVTTRR
ncbi:hypothetical protein IQ264_31615 [Phormidium sp. LEGE 05292]|uniref:hypothetical protein n=1 Tax=[Phormidium] sp. LEGE 05292 TaxID=767427 RepID=UPI00187FE9C0|nr:hypothetical protein [Phormidium sp. LEGE 05292]MBE9229951.1 hypothetical protein [Phormidium sp. LEGE 05292]